MEITTPCCSISCCVQPTKVIPQPTTRDDASPQTNQIPFPQNPTQAGVQIQQPIPQPTISLPTYDSLFDTSRILPTPSTQTSRIFISFRPASSSENQSLSPQQTTLSSAQV